MPFIKDTSGKAASQVDTVLSSTSPLKSCAQLACKPRPDGHICSGTADTTAPQLVVVVLSTKACVVLPHRSAQGPFVVLSHRFEQEPFGV